VQLRVTHRGWQRVVFAAALGIPCGGCTLLFPVSEFDSGEAHGFSERCADPNVVRCVGFDSAAEMKALYANEPCADIDSAVFTSGGGSLRVTVSTTGAADQCAVNFHPGESTDPPGLDASTFGPGETFFVQWRMRYDAAAFSADYGGENARDQLIIGPPDKDAAAGEWSAPFAVGVTSLSGRGFPTLMVAGQEAAPMTASGDFMLQNQVAGCTYQNQERCKRLIAEAWMTFEVAVTVGREGKPETRARAWFGVEGAASVPLIDVDGLTIGNATTPVGFGKVWLWPRVEAPGSMAPPEGHVWYDDLVISRAFIPDPAP